jgi:hypothetical protein
LERSELKYQPKRPDLNTLHEKGGAYTFAEAFLSVSAADSGVISRWGEPSSSKPTMNFRTVADRSSGG